MLVLLLIRRKAGQQNSYHKAQKNVLKSLEKESIEAIIEAVKGNNKELISEAADVIFHYLVMLKSRNIKFADVLTELEKKNQPIRYARKRREIIDAKKLYWLPKLAFLSSPNSLF